MTFQPQNRGEIRRTIGINLGGVIVGTATSTTDTSSLIDTYNFAFYTGDDEFNGSEVIIYDAAGSVVDGEKSMVADYAGATSDATVSPVFTASITSADKFELWKPPYRINDVNQAINDAIIKVSPQCLKIKEIHTTFTESAKYEYNVLSGYKGVYSVEYVYNVGMEKVIDRCDTAWSELVDADVTASADTVYKKEGTACLKLVVAAGCAAGDKLATQAISSLDLSGCNEIEIWIRSTVALDAGDIQLLLDNTALCATPVETLNIPATTANTTTRHLITLANPESDSAIISVGLKMAVDKGAFTLYADDIKAVDSATRQYKELNPWYWEIVKGSTPYLKLSLAGLSVAGTERQLRITGYQLPDVLSDDTTDCDIDPGYLVAAVTGKLMMSHAMTRELDIKDKANLAQFWLGEAERILRGMTTEYNGDTKWI